MNTTVNRSYKSRRNKNTKQDSNEMKVILLPIKKQRTNKNTKRGKRQNPVFNKENTQILRNPKENELKQSKNIKVPCRGCSGYRPNKQQNECKRDEHKTTVRTLNNSTTQNKQQNDERETNVKQR